MAKREGQEYVPITDRGEITHTVRQVRATFANLCDEVERLREG